MTGDTHMTFTVSANDVVPVEFDYMCRVNIFNDTNGDIYISDKNDFTGTHYIKLPEGAAYNGYKCGETNKNKFYIKAIGAGDISLAVEF